MRRTSLSISLFALVIWAASVPVPDATAAGLREAVVGAGINGGLLVHVGCGDGKATGELAGEWNGIIHGLDADSAKIAVARRFLASLGGYGRKVSVDTWDGEHTPYASGIANLVVLDSDTPGLREEAMRVLAPLGALLTRKGAGWEKTTKPWPDNIDEWTHYLHEADNNAVAHDELVGPPRSLRWVGSPRWARHHDRLPSMSALVTAGGRLFYIFDEGPTGSVVLPSKWSLIARDAFNGVVLWKKAIPEWQTRLWPLKSGPAQLPRRLVCTRDAVYATLGLDVRVTQVDAATGETLQTYAGTKGTEEILESDGVLFLALDPELDREKYTQPRAVSKPWWTGKTVKVVAVQASSGSILWSHDSKVVPLTLAVDDKGVFFHDGTQIVCLGRAKGGVLWQSAPVAIAKRVMSFFAPTLVVRDGVVVFAGGEKSGLVKSGGGAVESDTLTALDAATGKVLWTGEHLPSGYSSPEDVFVTGGLVWSGGVSNGRLPGAYRGYDLHTGNVTKSYDAADVQTYWFHHRCHRGKATDRFLMVSRTGIEFIDPNTGHWDINHWTRGGCSYGIMPANGLVYTPPHACACYPESKLFGFCALSASAEGVVASPRLETGPAYGQKSAGAAADFADWPTYRHDSRRTGSTTGELPATLAEKWRTKLGERLSTVTVAEGKVLAADIDAHAVIAVDAATGEKVWVHTAGGRVDSPPTIHDGSAIFGCADGWIYCLRATDGALVWRFRAAPTESRIMAFEQLESRWPVSGSVLVQNGIVHAIAGRSLFLDGGMRLCRVDARTGKLISEEILDERDPESGENIQKHIQRLTMPVALPDVLSSDGSHIYMRSQVFDMEGKRIEIAPHGAHTLGAHAAVQEGETEHLFGSAGFLDGDWFHRAYWVYGRSFEGGWNAYYLAGKRVPSGKILVHDKRRVYGFGRKPQYFKWTVPMEFHLFSAAIGKEEPEQAAPAPTDTGSIIRIDKSPSLNPAKQAVTVTAWVQSEGLDGAVLARGGSILGYSLHVRNGVPSFAVSANRETGVVSAKEKLSGDWTHLAGMLTGQGELRVYVNGRLAGNAKGPGLLASDPADSMQIGGDEGSQVANYGSGSPFKGTIDDVRVYHGALTETEIATLAAGKDIEKSGAKLAARYTFDNGKAADATKNHNRGTVVGAIPAPGKLGKGMRFSGKLPEEGATGSDRFVWSNEVPILVRGMVATGKTLFIAGPDDVLDEPGALKTLDDNATRQSIEKQFAAYTGQAGGVLRAVAKADGSTKTETRLDALPVWDGIVVARGCLFMAATDGTLRCYGAK